MRLGVELSAGEVFFLRQLSRPSRTGAPRYLGANFIAAGVLRAAIELLAEVEVDMHGIRAGDSAEMTARARSALIAAGRLSETGERDT